MRTRHLADGQAFAAVLAPLKKTKWFVYAKRPFAGPAAVLAYLSRYTHRVAISNRRLIALDDTGVTFRWKDYRADGRARYKTMTLATAEFIRRFLLHVLPSGFHRIRHYGLFANGSRAATLARARALLDAATPRRAEAEGKVSEETGEDADAAATPAHRCPCRGGRMIHHRDLRRRHHPAPPTVGTHRHDQDRHVMTAIAALQPRNNPRPPCRSSTGRNPARSDAPDRPQKGSRTAAPTVTPEPQIQPKPPARSARRPVRVSRSRPGRPVAPTKSP